MEIKIIWAENKLQGVQKTALGQFHDYNERYPYLGSYGEGKIINARLVYQAWYPGDQWTDMPDWIALTSDRPTRRIYLDEY